MRDSIVRDVLVDTGLRVAEMCAADVGDLFTVEQQTALQVTVKGGNTVQVPISKATVERLRDWLLSRNMPDPGEPIFIDTTGKRYHRAAMSHLIVRLGKVAGITRFEVTPHVVRHTLELIRRRAGIDPTVRSRLLTHSSLGSLVSYQHLLPDELAEARQQQVEGLRRYIGIADAGPQDYTSGLYQEGAGEERKSAEY
jgi:integrase